MLFFGIEEDDDGDDDKSLGILTDTHQDLGHYTGNKTTQLSRLSSVYLRLKRVIFVLLFQDPSLLTQDPHSSNAIPNYLTFRILNFSNKVLSYLVQCHSRMLIYCFYVFWHANFSFSILFGIDFSQSGLIHTPKIIITYKFGFSNNNNQNESNILLCSIKLN